MFELDKMKQHRWYVNEVTDEFIYHKDPTLRVKLRYKLGHLYLEWPPSLVLSSRPDLLKLHRRFAHPSPEKLGNLLQKAAPDQ